MKKHILMLPTSIAVIIAFTFGTSGTAFADNNTLPSAPACSTNAQGTTLCVSAASSVSSSSVSVTDANAASAHGATNVYFIQSHGATHSQMKGKKVRIKKSMTLWTSYYNSSHHEVWHWKTYPRGYTFVKGSDGWYHDPHCWNKVKIKTKKHVGHKVYGKIVVHQFWTLKVNSKVVAMGNGRAAASCENNGAKAFATASYMFQVTGTSSATVTGDSWTTVRNRSAAAGKKLLQNLKTRMLVEARTSVSVKASGQAAASANCSSSSTPGTPTPPTCESVYGPGYTGTYPNCTKDGTTTPPPPTTAPGPNPPPSGGTGDPGSNQCYDPVTGTPVPPGTPGAWC
jgi:hypothetical protein